MPGRTDFMRIMLFVHSLRRGGAERVLLELALGLKEKGHAVEVISWLDVDEYPEPRYFQVSRHSLIRKEEYRWPWSVPASARLLRRAVEEFKPDVIEIHTNTVAWVAAAAGLDISAVYSLHGYGPITRNLSLRGRMVRFLDRIAQRRLHTSYFTAPTEGVIETAAAHFSVAASNFCRIPNGVALSGFYPDGEKQPGNATILMLGTVSRNKGQHAGLKAFSELLKSVPKAKLWIVGDGPDAGSLGAQVAAYGLSEKVELMGRREDVPEIMRRVGMLWHLSESEGLPMVVLEAMASGLPVVGFSVRGTRDAVEDGSTGFLLPLGDVKAVAEKTALILSNPQLSNSMAQQARKRAEEFFGVQRMVDGHERVLQAALRKSL